MLRSGCRGTDDALVGSSGSDTFEFDEDRVREGDPCALASVALRREPVPFTAVVSRPLFAKRGLHAVERLSGQLISQVEVHLNPPAVPKTPLLLCR